MCQVKTNTPGICALYIKSMFSLLRQLARGAAFILNRITYQLSMHILVVSTYIYTWCIYFVEPSAMLSFHLSYMNPSIY